MSDEKPKASSKAERQRERRAQERQERQEHERAVILHERILPMDRLGVSAGAIAAALLTKGIKGYDHRKVAQMIAEEQVHPTTPPQKQESRVFQSYAEAQASLPGVLTIRMRNVAAEFKLADESPYSTHTVEQSSGDSREVDTMTYPDEYDEDHPEVAVRKYHEKLTELKAAATPKLVTYYVRLEEATARAEKKAAEPANPDPWPTERKLRLSVCGWSWRKPMMMILHRYDVRDCCDLVAQNLVERTGIEVYGVLERLADRSISAKEAGYRLNDAKFIVRCLVHEVALYHQFVKDQQAALPRP